MGRPEDGEPAPEQKLAQAFLDAEDPLAPCCSKSIIDRIDSSLTNLPSLERKFGDYELIEEIARGGMGVIWKARHVPLGRLVALKLIRDSHLASPKARDRFRVEAEAAGRLHHPNIVPIYEFGTVEGHPFIAMPLMEGADLGRLLHGTPMQAERVGQLLMKLAHAIHFAHQRGILHLDLKPANVLVDPGGEPHVTDFGLAKRLDQQDATTVASGIVGSPNYMAPEQISGPAEELTTAADVYSLGAIMYELLTGRAPFRSDSPLATLRKVQEEDPIPPRTVYKFADPELETICLKCLEKTPDRRYTSARALAAELERWLNHEPIEARPVTVTGRATKWVRRNPGISALLLLVNVLLILGVSGIIWMGARASARARESQDRLLRMYVNHGNQLLDAREDFSALLWFTEALRLEQGGPVREENHRYRIQAALAHSSVLQQAIFHKEPIRAANFDPSGRRLIIGTATGSAMVWDAITGRQISPEMSLPASVHRVRFSPDGRRVLTMDIKGNARIWDPGTGTPVTSVLRGDAYDHRTRADDPASARPATPMLGGNDSPNEQMDWAVQKLDPSGWFSPDGAKLLTAWGCQSAHLWEVSSGKHLLAFPHSTLVVFAKFSSDGKYVVTGSKDNCAKIWDAATGEPLSKPLPHDEFVAWAGFDSSDGRLLTLSGRHVVHVWDWRIGRELIPPLSHGDALFAAAFSPDGRQILTAGWDKTTRIWDSATGLEVARYSIPGGVASAAWSPDGRSIATACEDGTARIWDATGSAKLLYALPHGSGNFYLSYSGDGKQLVTFGFGGTARIWNVSQEDKTSPQMRHEHSVWAEFNPDATRIVSAGFWPANDIKIFDAVTGSQIGPTLQHTGSVHTARFSFDGKRLVTASDDYTARIWDTLSGRELTSPLRHPGGVLDAAFSPDGDRIGTACYDGAGRLWEAGSGRLIATLQHSKKVTSIVFDGQGRLVATASDDSTARVWDARNGTPLTSPLLHRDVVNSVRFNRTGSQLLTGSDAPGNAKAEVVLWDVQSGQRIGRQIEIDDDVNDAEFSPDEHQILTASQDHTARVWDARTGQPVTPPMWHLDGVLQAIFSPDGHRVVTLTTQGAVRVWDAITGEAVTTSLDHPHGFDMGHMMFSPDGKHLLIATGGSGPVIREFKLTNMPIPSLVDLAELLSGHRLDASAGIVRLDPSTLSRRWHDMSAGH